MHSSPHEIHFANSVLKASLEYLKNQPELLEQLLHNLGVEKANIFDEKKWHSAEFSEKFHAEFIRLTGGDEEIVKTAAKNLYAQSNFKLFTSTVGLLVTPWKFLSFLPRLAARMNRYNTYEYQEKSGDFSEVTGQLTQHYQDLGHQRLNYYLCLSARGSIEGITQFFGYRLVHFEHSKCIKNGDSSCEYKVTWRRRFHLLNWIIALLSGALTYLGSELFDFRIENLGKTNLSLFHALVISFLVYFSIRYVSGRKSLKNMFQFQQETLENNIDLLRKYEELNRQNLNFQSEFAETVKLAQLGEMSYGIMHDMATPLMMLVSASAYLSKPNVEENEGKNSENLKKNIERIHRATNLLIKFQNVLRTSMRSENLQKVVLLDPKKAVEETTLLFKGHCLQNEIQLDVEINPKVRGLELYESLFERVLLNLVYNSIKALTQSQNKKTLKVSLDDLGSALVLTVEDSGPGIPQKQLNEIFKRFQNSSENSQSIKGSGFGIYNVKKLVDSIDGKLSIESQVGRGTQVRIEIPYAQKNQIRIAA